VEPTTDKYLGAKTVIPDHRLMLIPLEERKEAYYLAGVLNSSISKLIVMSYTIETAISTHVTKNVYVPEFSKKNPIHTKIAELSKKAHIVAARIYGENQDQKKEELLRLEGEIDKAVTLLYGMTPAQLKEVRRTLRLLKKGTIE